MTTIEHKKRDQEPLYQNNMGTSVAIGGEGFVVIASDTRMSLDEDNYCILTRNSTKVYELTKTCCLTGSGMRADVQELVEVIKKEIKKYRYANNKDMSVKSIAQLVQCVLYSKRTFPYYWFTMLCGIENGKGIVYHYDAIGSYTGNQFDAAGSGQQIIMPIVDSQLKKRTERLSVTEAQNIARDALTSTAEIEIYTGDDCELVTITEEGVKRERFFMVKD